MLFCWGENECLRAWTINGTGQVSFVAKSAEVASAGMGGKGGMPGGFLAVTSNGSSPNTGIVWATAHQPPHRRHPSTAICSALKDGLRSPVLK
jgi:hypothetical protein